MRKVEEKLTQKYLKLQKTSKKLDILRGGYKSVWFDLGHLKSKRDELDVSLNIFFNINQYLKNIIGRKQKTNKFIKEI